MQRAESDIETPPFPFFSPWQTELSPSSLPPLGPGETASSQLWVENALPELPSLQLGFTGTHLQEFLSASPSLFTSLQTSLLPNSSSFSHWLPRQFHDLHSSPSASSRSSVSSGSLSALGRHRPLLCLPDTWILKGSKPHCSVTRTALCICLWLWCCLGHAVHIAGTPGRCVDLNPECNRMGGLAATIHVTEEETEVWLLGILSSLPLWASVSSSIQ